MTWWTRTPDRFIDVGDCSLPYWTEGSGPDLVFVHGWPLDSRTWRGAVEVLKESFTCHLFDLPGTGQSKWDRSTRAGFRQNTVALGKVIDALGLESYALLGHDSGGLFARLHAAEHPERVWGLVLGNTEIPGHVPWLLTALVVGMRMPGAKTVMRAALGSKLGRRLPMTLGGAFDDLSFTDEGEFYEFFLRPMIESDRAYAGQQLLAHGLDPKIIDELATVHAAIDAPTLLLWGKDDPWFPLAHAEPMAEQFGGPVQLQPMDGRLFVHEEHAEAWAHAAGAFLAKSAEQLAA